MELPGKKNTGLEPRHAGDASQQQDNEDVWNGGEVKSHVGKCRLIETG